jgi:hypothetical protein
MTSLSEVTRVAKPHLRVVSEERSDVPELSFDAATRGLQLPARGKELLRVRPTDAEDRSNRLFELASILRDAGASEEATFVILQRSPWNKFEGRDDEVIRLWEAVERSREDVHLHVPRRSRLSRARSIGHLLARDIKPPQWLVENIWEDRGWGFIAGEPKTYKSTFATDLAVSVASASPFLGHFNVCKSAPVLIVQEENAENIQHSRLARILRSKGQGGEVHSLNGTVLEMTAPNWDCPVYCLDRTRFSFNNGKKRRALEADIKAIQPGLVIFDPIQRMMGDLNIRNEADVTKCLDWLDKVSHDYKTGLLIVHHYHKRREEGPQEGGQRMLGSQALHAWLTCGLYVSRISGGHLKVAREFRAFDSGQPFELEFDSQDDEDFYEVRVVEHETNTPRKDELLQMVIERPWHSATEYAKLLNKVDRSYNSAKQAHGSWACAKEKSAKASKGGRP